MKNRELIYKLYNVCYRVTGDRHLAEELCTNTIEKLPTVLDAKDGFITALKIATELLLRQKACNTAPDEILEDSSMLVQKALMKLPTKERIVVTLHDICGLSYSDIMLILINEDVHLLSQRGREKIVRSLHNC